MVRCSVEMQAGERRRSRPIVDGPRKCLSVRLSVLGRLALWM